LNVVSSATSSARYKKRPTKSEEKMYCAKARQLRFRSDINVFETSSSKVAKCVEYLTHPHKYVGGSVSCIRQCRLGKFVGFLIFNVASISRGCHIVQQQAGIVFTTADGSWHVRLQEQGEQRPYSMLRYHCCHCCSEICQWCMRLLSLEWRTLPSESGKHGEWARLLEVRLDSASIAAQ
jgi:hypothetical protein